LTINNNINPLYIIESDSVESIDNKSCVYIWNGHEKNEKYISISNRLEDNSDKIKKKYIKFIHDLGEEKIDNKNLKSHLKIKENYNLWWMSLLTEKSHYKSPRIKDCLKFLVLEEIILEKKPSKIIVLLSDKIIIRSIKELSKKLNIEIEIKKIDIVKKDQVNSKNIFSNIYFKSPNIIKSIIYLIRYSFNNWTFKKALKPKWETNKNILFFSYLFHLDKDSFKDNKFNTSQWGPLTNLLNELSIKSNWMHHFIPNPVIPNRKSAISFINNLNKEFNNIQSHQIISGYINIKTILKVVANYAKIILKIPNLFKFKKLFIVKNSNINFWFFLKDDFINSILGPKLIENLFWIEHFDNALSKIPYQEKGIYLQENQSWEKALISAWKKYNHGKIYGLNNGFVRYWDLRFFDDSNTVKDNSDFKIPLPDRIILTDQISWDYYLNSGYEVNKLIKAETLRYFSVLSKNLEKKHELKADQKIKGLILGDIIFDSTNEMIKNLENINSTNFHWTIKSHPACLINIKNYKKITLENSYENLEDIIHKYDLVIAPAATLSALDSYLSNIKTIIFLAKDELNISPLRGFKDIKITYDNTSLKEALSLNNLNNYNFNKQDFFWYDKNLNFWKEILK
tara:strand:- start:1217 stop:3094 length:1878 start_codon:yes stop_codon:yes gene_type:complete